MRKPPPTLAGFSLVDGLVLTTLMIGALGSVLISAIFSVCITANKAKLEQDVVMVNDGIDACLVAGEPGRAKLAAVKRALGCAILPPKGNYDRCRQSS
jgi:hypothetical protein